jgi:hypothetical protein
MDNIGKYISNFFSKNNSPKCVYDIKIGKTINENCFNINIDKIKFWQIIKNIKKNFLTDNITYSIIKRYNNANLQIDCYENGIQKCVFKKPKDILDMSIDKKAFDLRIIANKQNNLPSHVFPCNNLYHAVCNIESIVMDYKFYKIIFNHITQDGMDFYQMNIQYTYNPNHKKYDMIIDTIINIIKNILHT